MSKNSTFTESNTLELKLALGMASEDIRGELSVRPESRTVVPGLNDIQLAKVSRVGQRHEFIQPHDWENLLPTLTPGQELLWIIRKEHGQFHFFLGVKANGEVLSSPETARERRQEFSAVVNHFGRRCFPESRLEQLDHAKTVSVLNELELAGNGHLTIVTGVPSPKLIDEGSTFGDRDVERRPYATLNDVLEPFMDEESFTLIFSLSRSSRQELERELQAASNIRSELRPLIEGEKSKSKGGQQNNIRGGGESENQGENYTEGRNILAKLWQTVRGSKGPESMKKMDWGRGAPVSYSSGSSINTNWQESSGSNWSESDTIHWFNGQYKLIDELMELRIKHLTQAMGTGAYRGYIAVYTGSKHLGRRIGKTLSATLGGARSHLRPFQSISYSGRYTDFPLRYCVPGYSFLPDVPVLDADQACQLMLMPDAELPGLNLKKAVFYGRAPDSRHSSSEAATVTLGHSAFHEPIMRTGSFHEPVPVQISQEDVLSHILIAGTTGSGKTQRTLDIINRLGSDDFHIIVIETAKKTYRRYLNRGRKPVVYSLGGGSGTPFRINPFYFDPGTNLKKHISVLADALNDLLPVEALIGPKLREAILRCYTSMGWNIESGTFRGTGEPYYPTMVEFNHEVERICAQLSYSAEINQNYRGALLGRSRLFVDDLYQDLFVFGGESSFEEMFGQDTILELDDLPPSETNMPAFVTSIVLQRLRAHAELRRQKAGRKAEPPYYLVVVEEAHNILHRRLEDNQDQRQTGGSRHLLNQVVRLLQEGRDLGIGVLVLDQSPESLADAVRKNTNTKIVHRIIDGAETEVIGKSLGLLEEDWPDLTQLGTGECIVGLLKGGRPIKLAPIDETALPQLTPYDWELAPAEPYTDVDRLLTAVSKLTPSVSFVEEAANKLLTLCNKDTVKAGRLLGRWRAWNSQWLSEGVDSRGLFQQDKEYRCPRTREELLQDLFQLRSDQALDVAILREVAVLLLLGAQTSGDFTPASAQNEVFGPDWLTRAWPVLLDVIRQTRRLGYDPDVVAEVQAVLKEWSAASGAGDMSWIHRDQESREFVIHIAVALFLFSFDNEILLALDALTSFFGPSKADMLRSVFMEQAEARKTSHEEPIHKHPASTSAF